MGKTKHTAGKWIASNSIFTHVETTDGQWVCQMSNIKEKETPFLSDEYEAEAQRVREERHANSKLIASAPELLEALQSVADFYSAKVEQTKGAEQFNWECRLKEVQKVIDKATS
jgi:hypothetical protein